MQEDHLVAFSPSLQALQPVRVVDVLEIPFVQFLRYCVAFLRSRKHLGLAKLWNHRSSFALLESGGLYSEELVVSPLLFVE